MSFTYLRSHQLLKGLNCNWHTSEMQMAHLNATAHRLRTSAVIIAVTAVLQFERVYSKSNARNIHHKTLKFASNLVNYIQHLKFGKLVD